MEEKVLIKSKSASLTSVLLRCFAIPIAIFMITIVYYYAFALPELTKHAFSINASLSLFLTSTLIFDVTVTRSIFISVFAYIGIATLIWGIVSFLKYKDMDLTITDKRVYGRSSFGKRIDLPFNTINSVSSVGKRNIEFLTPSGKILFGNFENCDEIFQLVSKMLVERQR